MLGGNFLHFIADYLENWKGGMLNAFAWPLTYSDQQRASIVYRADYQGI